MAETSISIKELGAAIKKKAGGQLDQFSDEDIARRFRQYNPNIKVTDFVSDFGSRQEKSYKEKTPIFKSVTGFGETLGGGLASLDPTIRAQQQEVSSRGLDLNQKVLEKLRDPNVSREQKIRLAQMAGFNEDIISRAIPQTQKSLSEIGGEAGGTLLTALTAGTAPGALGGTALGRIAYGTALGAGGGTVSGLSQNKSAGEIAKEAGQGAAIGAAFGTAAEGIGSIIHKIGQSRRVGATGSRFLGESSKDVANELKSGYDSVGRQMLEQTDDTGKFVYQGGLNKVLNTSQKEIAASTKAAREVARQNPGLVINKNSVADDVVSQLADQFTDLTGSELNKVQTEFNRYFGNKVNFSPDELLNIRQSVDKQINPRYWKSVLSGNTKGAFGDHVRYTIRNSIRKQMNQQLANTPFEKLNLRASLAYDIQDLAALQVARRSLKPSIFPTSIREAIEGTSNVFRPLKLNTARRLEGIKKTAPNLRAAIRQSLIVGSSRQE